MSDEAFVSVGSVVGEDEDVIGERTHLLFEDDEFLSTSGEHDEYPVPELPEGFDDGQKRSGADPTGGTEECTDVCDVSGLSEWPDDVGESLPDIEGAYLAGGDADGLNDEGDGTFGDIGAGDGERDALAFLANPDDDKMSGLPGACN
jgi:hypothetical protein